MFTFPTTFFAGNDLKAFKVVAWEGTGIAQNIAVGFQPDLVIIANQTGAGEAWLAFDSIRGATEYVGFSNPNLGSNFDGQSLRAFIATGFTVGTSNIVNQNTENYIAFCWKNSLLFNVLNYSGTGSAQNISHSLGSIPQMIFDGDFNGHPTYTYSPNLESSTPASYYVDFNSNGALTAINNATIWNAATPTSSVFSVAGTGLVNTNGTIFYAYLFARIGGVSAIGTYAGNGSMSGPTISGLGFKPSLVMICQQNAVIINWRMFWGPVVNAIGEGGCLNTELNADGTAYLILVAGGFNVVTTNGDFNTNGKTYFYMAWK